MFYFTEFLFYYPTFMTFIWISGAFVFFIRHELHESKMVDSPGFDSYEKVTILVPCYNEESTISETISSLDLINYPNFEVIAINDGSTDNTLIELIKLSKHLSWLRLINLKENAGKATCLNLGLISSNSEFIVCLDADTTVAPDSVTWMMHHLMKHPDLGAVTGNPRIRNRDSLLGKIQVGEFSAIVGMIKRSQRVAVGNIFTISGVFAAFRKSALIDVGLWDSDIVTEDIDISWKLQRNSWKIFFEPRATCMTLMPETLKGLWKQRLRWAEGGFEVIMKNNMFFSFWKHPGLFVLFIDYLVSVVWIISVLSTLWFWILNHLQIIHLSPFLIGVNTLSKAKVLIVLICLIQFGVGIFLDSRYEKNSGKFYYWTIWYPLFYWVISALTIMIGIPKAILGKKEQFATWDSPDRGHLDIRVNSRLNLK